MKKQEMNPNKDQNRSSDKNQIQDKPLKAKTQQEDKTMKGPRSNDEEADKDFADFEKQSVHKDGNRQQSNDYKKNK